MLPFCGGAKYDNPISERYLSAPHSADATMTDRMDGTERDSRYRVAVRRGPRISLDPHRKSPDPKDTNSVRDWLETRSRPWAIDLFCGAGGLSLGLEEGGFSVVAAADSDPVAIETHAANIQGLTWTGNLSNPTEFLRRLDNWGIEDVDLLAGVLRASPSPGWTAGRPVTFKGFPSPTACGIWGESIAIDHLRSGTGGHTWSI